MSDCPIKFIMEVNGDGKGVGCYARLREDVCGPHLATRGEGTGTAQDMIYDYLWSHIVRSCVSLFPLSAGRVSFMPFKQTM